MRPAFHAIVESNWRNMSKSYDTPKARATEIKDKKIRQERIKGALAISGGGYAIHKAKPLVTGRTTLYHGTSKANVPSILEKGILPSYKQGIQHVVLSGDVAAKSKDLAFTTKSKMAARGYATQQAGLEHRGHQLNWLPQGRQLDALKDTFNPEIKTGIVKASVPLWRDKIKSKIVHNPEAGKLSDFMEIHGKGDPLGAAISHSSLGSNTKAFEGGLPNKYLVKSKNYMKLTPREIKIYAAKHPGKFTGGLALGAAGIGTTGYGINKWRKTK